MENLTQLNEVFDSENTYPVTNLTPKAKVPQILHVQAPGTNDIVVRLTSSDTIGTRVKAVKPGDKAVQVFLTSMSAKGNITDFKGGLGSDPIGAINTIFDTVVSICKEYRIESILFRFPKSKLKGKDQVAQRIIKRLTKTRSGGRFTTLDEVEGLSKKFSFVLLYRKGKVLADIPGIPNIDPEKFEKVETKVGETFISKETGQSVTKAEVIAQTIVSAAEKVTTQQAITITKVSRRAITAALYANMSDTVIAPENRDYFMENNESIHLADSSVPVTKMLVNLTNDDVQPASLLAQNKSSIELSIKNTLLSKVSIDNTESVLSDVLAAWNRAKTDNMQSFYIDLANILSTGPMRNLSKLDRIMIGDSILMGLTPLTRQMEVSFAGTPPEWSALTENEKQAIREYTGSEYDRINPMLMGTRKRAESIASLVNDMDSAFSKGTRLKKGTLLFRGMGISKGQFTDVVREGYYYFHNFISTSLMPSNIYNGYQDNLDALNPNAEDITDRDDLSNSNLYNPYDANSINTKVGLIMSGTDKVKVIIPGSESEFPHECEVILPRGLLFKVTKAMAESTSDQSYGPQRKALLYLDLVNPNQLDETAEIFDGSLMLQEGKIEKIQPDFSFSKLYQLNESELVDADAEDVLVSLIGFGNLTKKFIQ